MHQNRASRFASDFYRRRGYRREFRSEDCHFTHFLRRRNRGSLVIFFAEEIAHPWGLKKSRDFLGSGENRRRSRRESRDFGALSSAGICAHSQLRPDVCACFRVGNGKMRQSAWTSSHEFSAPAHRWEANGVVTCSVCHLYFVKEFPRFGRKISAKIG